MTEAIVALDLGTSSTKAFLYGLDGTPLSLASKPLAVSTPEVGWVEQDPQTMLDDSIQVLTEVLNQKQIKPLALGIANQRETTIVWDKITKKAIYPAIVWQDRRTQDTCQAMDSYRDMIHQRTGLVLDPYFSALKIAWILDNVPGAREKAQRGELLFGTVDSFILWHLTGGIHATDMTNASRTMLFNIHTRTWDEQLCELFNVPMNMLAKVKSSDALFGNMTAQFSNIPIAGIIGDQQSASLGQGCIQPGDLKSTFGTGSFMLLNTGDKMHLSMNKLLTTIGLSAASNIDYALEGSLFNAGDVIRWLRDNLKILPEVSQSAQVGKEVGISHEVYMIPALSGLGAPTWDPSAKAAFFGMGLETTSQHLIASCLEAICFQTKLLVDTFEQDTQQKVKQCFVDGGMSANDWFCQLLSHTLNAKIIRPKNVETTSVGAAFLAGVGIGLFEMKDVAQFKTIDKVFSPDSSHQTLNEKYQTWLHYLSLVSQTPTISTDTNKMSQTS